MTDLHQPSLLDWKPKGPFITPADEKRLGKQMQAVLDYMSDGEWHTLEAISKATGYRHTPSLSARFRDLHNQLGRETKRRKTDIPGLFEYRLVTTTNPNEMLRSGRNHNGEVAP